MAVTKEKKIILYRKNGTENNAESSTMPLYHLMICSHLEYCVQVWMYCLKNEMKQNEVQ